VEGRFVLRRMGVRLLGFADFAVGGSGLAYLVVRAHTRHRRAAHTHAADDGEHSNEHQLRGRGQAGSGRVRPGSRRVESQTQIGYL
jgi:hypothetical protein